MAAVTLIVRRKQSMIATKRTVITKPLLLNIISGRDKGRKGR